MLDDEQVAHWIGVLNDARLAVGTALEVTAEWDFDALDPDVPNYELHTLVRLDDPAARGAPRGRRLTEISIPLGRRGAARGRCATPAT